MNELRRDMLKPYVARLNEAGHGEKTAIVTDCAAKFGWSFQKALRLLKEVGYEPPKRKTRSDKGKTAVTEEAIKLVAAVQKTGISKDGKDTLHVTGAYCAAQAAGVDLGVSVARTRALLRERQLDQKSVSRPTPHVHMRSLHPNHVHQVDPSLSRLYYAPGGIARIEDSEAYRNKQDGFKKLKLWRYVLTDHYSGCVCIRYYESAGENQANLYDFLLYAWGKKAENLYQFHGAPDVLLLDSGSANISRAMTYALKALDIRVIPHKVGNPRAKGQVEKANHASEVFEGLLRLEPQMSVEAINHYADKWCARYNANRIPGYNSRLKRNGMHFNRMDLWLQINQDQLRELPPLPICRDLLTLEPQRVVVRGDLFIQYDGRFYSLAFPGIYAGMEVFIQPLLMRREKILRVHYQDDLGENISFEVKPVQTNEENGFFSESPIVGQEFKSNKKTVLEHNVDMLDEMIGNPVVPFNGEIKTMSHLDKPTSGPTYMPRTSDPLTITGGPVFEEILTPAQAAKRLRQSLGFWDAFCVEYLEKNYPACIKESDLPIIESCLRGARNDGERAQTSAV